MKIAFILPSLKNSGPCIVAKDLCEQYVSMGHICKVYYFDDIVELDMPCEVKRISFIETIDFKKWDVIHSHMFRPDLYVRIHALFCKHIPTKFITTLHNPISVSHLCLLYNRLIAIVIAILWKWALNVHDSVVFLNEHLKNSTNLHSKTAKYVIFNGRDIDTDKNIQNREDEILIKKLKINYNVIGTTSVITKRKGLEQIVKALKLLTNCALVVVGDGPELDKLKNLADECGVSHRCLWLGYREDAALYHKYFDVFVMCTRSEGFPLALIESAAYGNPTVLSNIEILKSLITDNEVLFYELDDIEDLSSCVKLALNKRTILSNNILKYYKNKLTAQHMANRYIQLYKLLKKDVSI